RGRHANRPGAGSGGQGRRRAGQDAKQRRNLQEHGRLDAICRDMVVRRRRILSSSMAHTTLVDPATLAAHLGDPRWAVVDCRFMLTDAGWGAREYVARHIPGAVYAHLESDLSGPVSGY